MSTYGFKAFDKNMKNRYGIEFEEGKTYQTDSDVSFGHTRGKKVNGYHFCKNLEDTLRYVDGINDDIKIAEVIGSGNIVIYNDEYYGYYDMYSAEIIDIIHILTREEIINKVLYSKNEYAAERFIKGFKLTIEELEKFKTEYISSYRLQYFLNTQEKNKVLELK